MDKKERALHELESELDSITQSMYCSEKCSLCPYIRRLHHLQGQVRILMDYGHKTKNKTLTSYAIAKWGAGKKRATKENQRSKRKKVQKQL